MGRNSLKRGNTALIGIAGVHYVVSELSRRGLLALPTIRNTAYYDVIAARVDGSKHANIQVKTSSKNARFWPMPPPRKIRGGRGDYYVFLRTVDDSGPYEGFLVKGGEVKRAVSEEIRKEQIRVKEGSRKELFSAFHVDGRNKRKAERWAKQWEKWKL